MMPLPRHRLSTRERRALYDSAVEEAKKLGREHPACNLCPHPIRPGEAWDVSHDPQKPHWLSGEPATQLAHRRCNRIWNAQHDTPLFAKNNRQRDKFRDIRRSSNPLPGGREDRIKRTLSGMLIDRETGERWGVRNG